MRRYKKGECDSNIGNETLIHSPPLLGATCRTARGILRTYRGDQLASCMDSFHDTKQLLLTYATAWAHPPKEVVEATVLIGLTLGSLALSPLLAASITSPLIGLSAEPLRSTLGGHDWTYVLRSGGPSPKSWGAAKLVKVSTNTMALRSCLQSRFQTRGRNLITSSPQVSDVLRVSIVDRLTPCSKGTYVPRTPPIFHVLA